MSSTGYVFLVLGGCTVSRIEEILPVSAVFALSLAGVVFIDKWNVEESLRSG
jgi:hypothetical protein